MMVTTEDLPVAQVLVGARDIDPVLLPEGSLPFSTEGFD
jgi:hypothetical protein